MLPGCPTPYPTPIPAYIPHPLPLPTPAYPLPAPPLSLACPTPYPCRVICSHLPPNLCHLLLILVQEESEMLSVLDTAGSTGGWVPRPDWWVGPATHVCSAADADLPPPHPQMWMAFQCTYSLCT